nr:aspartic and glutamic acid-rich protein-like [Ipomoea batatas]
MKKKELEELEATLAEFGYNQLEKKDDSLGATHSKKVENVMNGEEDKKDDEQQDQPNGVEVGNAKEKDESGGVEKAEDAHNVDVKEKLKKVQSMKKKKSRMLQPKLLQRKKRITTTTSSHNGKFLLFFLELGMNIYISYYCPLSNGEEHRNFVLIIRAFAKTKLNMSLMNN